MSLNEKQMLDVMTFADGELEGDELARVKALVESDAEAKELCASLHAIGDGVRATQETNDATSRRDIDLADVVMAKLTPNDFDKARIRRTARTRMVVVGASLVALAAAVLLYVRDANNGVAPQATASAPSGQSVLASSSVTGVEVDFVDTPTPVSIFYVPAESTMAGAEGKVTETPPSVVVWVDEPSTAESTP